MTARLARLAVLVGAIGLLASAGALASVPAGPAPTISGLSTYVAAGGQEVVVNGSHLASDVASDCTNLVSPYHPPRVNFHELNSNNVYTVDPVALDASKCNNGSVHVKVPAQLTSAAHVTLTDPNGQESTGGYQPLLTLAPSASLVPSAGPVGQVVTARGGNLRPASLAPGAVLRLRIGGTGCDDRNGYAAALRQAGWTSTGVTFDPANHSGPVWVCFAVSRDASNDNVTVDASLNAGSYTFQPPALAGTRLTHMVVGSRVTLPGSNLGGTAGAVTFSGGVAGQSVQWSPTGISVTVPPGAQDGGILADVASFGRVGGPTVQVDPSVSATSPSSGSAGQAVRVSGYNFGASRGTLLVGGAGQTVTGWSDQAVTFAVGSDTDSGAVNVIRADGASVAAGTLAVVPRLDRLEAGSVQPGSQVVVDGVSLGASQGTARLGAYPVQTLLWSRTSALLQVPAEISPGPYSLSVTSAGGATSNVLRLTVVAAPTAAPGGPAKPAVVQPGGVVAPSFDNNHDFVKPIKPPSPVYFNVTTDPHKVRAGGVADVVVLLKLNDKPLSGAQVKLSMLYTPGPDFLFTPDSGVTDADGAFHAKVRVSKVSGDSIIAATSGVFSDQDHVQGAGADGKVAVDPTLTNPAAQSSGFVPLALVGALAVALVAAGFYLNIRSTSAA